MNRRFAPAARRLRGSLAPPPDKSISHRAALLAGMSSEPVVIRNYLEGEDTHATLDAITELGALCQRRGAELIIRGTNLREAHETDAPIDVRNAGTLIRLLPGWLAAQEDRTFVLDGDASIRRRPVDRVARPLTEMGARIEATEGRFPPFTLHGSALHGIDYELPVASAQVKSCVLLAGLAADGTTIVREPLPTRDHTERMLLGAGVPVDRAPGRISLTNVDELEPEAFDVPADPSSAAFLVAAALLVRRSRIVLEGLTLNWTRTGFFRIAQRMGAVIVGDLEAPGTLADAEPIGDLDVSYGPLTGTTVEADEVPLAIDELPLVALLGCFADGETVVRGAGELRVKESDRIAGVVEGLNGLGGDLEATADGFVVRGRGGLRGGILESRGDHRLAMLGAIAGLASREGVEVRGMEAAAVSYPRFTDDLAALAG